MSDYVVAKYLRLSSEDADLNESGKDESNSIVNQRNLLDAFLHGKPEFADARVLEFCDDGYSGKNFDRPAVKELLNKVRSGEIHCVVVKDLSRFGRDYLTVGNYISRVFPFLGVRFIAVNDNIDSIRQADVDSMETSFKALIYDYYSRDLSRKVRSSKNARAQKGLFISPFAPYGYAKDPADRHHLIVDAEAASTVRRIFQLVSDGKSTAEIARMLNQDHVFTPMLYKKAHGCSRQKWESVGEENFWTKHMVRDIIRDERYTGSLTYGKTARDRVGYAHVVVQEKQDWIVAEHTHEPIITGEEFELAQKMLRAGSSRRGKRNAERPLAGKVRCGVCGHVMERRKRKQPDYHCRMPELTNAFACPTDTVAENDLLCSLAEALRLEATFAVELGKLYDEQRRETSKTAESLRGELAALRELSDALDQQKKALFEEWAQGDISDSSFQAKKEAVNQNKADTADRIKTLEERIDALLNRTTGENEYLSSFARHSCIEEISNEIAADVLHEIRVFPNGRIEIVWNHRAAKERLLAGLSELQKHTQAT